MRSIERLELNEQLHKVQRGEIYSNSNDDELDAFMASNAINLKAESCNRIITKLTSVKE